MPTAVLDAYAPAFSSITNRIRGAIFKQSDPVAPFASIIDAVVGHPAKIYHFPGIPRDNYNFSLDEIDGGGNPIRNLAYFSVVPSQIYGLLSRDDEQIKVDTTVGFTSGTQVAVFDGTAGTPDYRGWEIVPSELTARGILNKGLDYSWDKTTGTMTWLQPGDLLPVGQVYNIHFDPIQSTSVAASIPSINDFSVRIATGNDNILVTDFGNSIICEPLGSYMELQLPDITTIPQGRLLTVEVAACIGISELQCVKMIPDGADIINFLRGNIYLMSNESLQIYRFIRAGVSEWRVLRSVGNFFSLGQSISEDQIQSGVVCAKSLDGSSEDIFKYARFYNEFVLMLPGIQVCNYDDWITGNNKYLFSLANSSDSGNVDKFHFPDRRGLFERNNNAGKAGDYSIDTVGPHVHSVSPPASNSQTGSSKTTTGGDALGGDLPITPYFTAANSGTTETVPKHYLINKYILV